MESVLTGVESSAILEARVVGHDGGGGLTTLGSRAGPLQLPRLDLPLGAVMRVRIRAQDVLLAVQPPEGLSDRNVLAALVTDVSIASDSVAEIRLDAVGATLLSQVTAETVRAPEPVNRNETVGS